MISHVMSFGSCYQYFEQMFMYDNIVTLLVSPHMLNNQTNVLYQISYLSGTRESNLHTSEYDTPRRTMHKITFEPGKYYNSNEYGQLDYDIKMIIVEIFN